MFVAQELVALKVDPETRRRVKVLSAARGVEMWELVMHLVDAEYRRQFGPGSSDSDQAQS